MSRIIRLTESDLEEIISQVLKEQTSFLQKIRTTPQIYHDLYLRWVNFSDKIRPEIERLGKILYPANQMTKGNKDLRSTSEYRLLKDKEDAYCHQLASAMATKIFGEDISIIIGLANEWYGGLRIFFKGNPSKNVPKFSSWSSGYKEDEGNNKLGIELAKKFPNQSLSFYSKLVVDNINKNNFYDSSGKKHSTNINQNTYMV